MTDRPNPMRPHLRDIVRIDSADTRGDFVRLDRNERVEPLSAAETAILQGYLTPDLFIRYPDPKPLQDRLGAAEGLEPGWTIVTNGSDAAIRRFFQAFVNPGDRILIPSPTYEMYGVYASVFEGSVDRLEYPESRRLTPDDYVRALHHCRPKLLCIVNPDQPTGAMLTEADMATVVEAARQQNCLVIVDEAYWCPGESTACRLIPTFDNLAVTRSFSKSLGFGGVRLGALYANPALIEGATKVKGLHEVNTIALATGMMLLDHPEVITRYLASLEQGRALLADFCRRHNFGFPSCPAVFQLIDLPPVLDPARIVAALKARKWLIKGNFKAACIQNSLRVSLAGPEMMTEFLAAFEAVLNDPEIPR